MTKSKCDSPQLSVTGGTINAGAIAVGNNARATVNNASGALKRNGRDQILDRLTEVVNALEAHGATLPDREAASELVERIATETAKPKLDKLGLKSFLSTLADEVSSVGVIAKAVAGLSSVIMPLF